MLRLVVLFPLMLIFDGPLGEEIGWRGLLLPQLLKTMSPIGATVVVAVIWFVWHVPLYLADGKDFHAVAYFISVVATSFIFTWFYLKSGCSTFVAILLHATTNFALFLVIKSFNISNTTTLSHIHDALIAIVAAFALVYFWGRSEAQLAIAATRH
jgi:membrane protease YdiL (CAAX protease family)